MICTSLSTCLYTKYCFNIWYLLCSMWTWKTDTEIAERFWPRLKESLGTVHLHWCGCRYSFHVYHKDTSLSPGQPIACGLNTHLRHPAQPWAGECGNTSTAWQVHGLDLTWCPPTEHMPPHKTTTMAAFKHDTVKYELFVYLSRTSLCTTLVAGQLSYMQDVIV